MKTVAKILLVLLLAGCTMRMAVYAPHRSDTDDHRQVESNQDCLGCHDIAGKREHKADDDCLRCHRIVKGG